MKDIRPYVHALGAGAYILFLVTGIQFLQQPNEPDTFFVPVFALSMLVFSVAIMAYLFFFQPVLLFMEGKHRDAIDFFFKTLGAFAALVVVLLVVVLLGF